MVLCCGYKWLMATVGDKAYNCVVVCVVHLTLRRGSPGLLAPVIVELRYWTPLVKLFMRLLNARVSKWAEENDMFAQSQSAFRDNHSTTDGIYLLHSTIEKWTRKFGGQLYTAMIDFQKAFDYVVHNNVWMQLIKRAVAEWQHVGLVVKRSGVRSRLLPEL